MIGKTLSHYKILEQIGAGGMGVVYRARDERLGRDVALKLLPAETLGSESARRALENEARTASALNHPNICTIHDVGEAEGQFFVAMEYVEGKPLAQLIPTGGLPEEQVMRYGMQIADALAHAQERGIVHRDLKSANVVVTPEGRAKVLDFGLAQRARKEELEEVTRSRVSLATAGGIAGTLAYMAPEVLRGEAADARSDIWALGVMLYEMASGALPFRGTTGFDLTSGILRDSPASLAARVSAGLANVIQRCLAKDPAQRYQRAGEVRVALEMVGTVSATQIPPAVGVARSRRHWLWVLPLGLLAIATVLVAFNAGGLREKLFPSSAQPKIESIAVLPLANLSGDPNQEYFADGMTEALISNLAQIGSLKVISRTSVMQYKGARKPLPQIAKELGVDAVVEGSVQRAGDRVKITAQLIHAVTDAHLWAKDYERDLRDVLTLQNEVARAIANEIRIELTPNEKERLGKERPVNPAAHELYLKGRYFWNQRAEAALVKSVDYFQKAIEQDPGYAPAYAGLADAYSVLGSNRFRDPHEVFPKAEAAALQALELDDTLSEAHAALGFSKLYYEWDWAGSQREFKRAIELNPGNANAHQRYGYLISRFGQHDKAVAELRRARELDPFFHRLRLALGDALLNARRYDEAFQEFQQALELNPNDVYVYFMLGRIYMGKRMYSEAITALQQGLQLFPNSAFLLGQLGHAYAVSGKPNEARRVLSELQRLSKRRYVFASDMAVVHIGLGDKDQAFAWLEKAYQDRDPQLSFLRVWPEYDPLRSEPRFRDLVRRMKFPESGEK